MITNDKTVVVKIQSSHTPTSKGIASRNERKAVDEEKLPVNHSFTVLRKLDLRNEVRVNP